jgi:hypothetical protein
MVKQKMKTLLTCSYSLHMWHNLIMKSKFPSEKCFNICKIGTCILQTIQICEEQWTCIHIVKTCSNREIIKVYFEHFMKLVNNVQTKLTNSFFYYSVQVEGKLTPHIGIMVKTPKSI